MNLSIKYLPSWIKVVLLISITSPQCHSFSNKYSRVTNYDHSTTKKNAFPQNRKTTFNSQEKNSHMHNQLSSPTMLHSSSVSLIEQTISSSSTTLSFIFSNDDIKQAFNVATFFPQPFWLLLILIPNSNFTKKVMGGLGT